MLSKKGQSVASLPIWIQYLVLSCVILAVGLVVMAKFMELNTDATVDLVLNDSIDAVGGLVDWLPLIVLGIAVSIVIALLFRSFISPGKGA